MFKILIQMMIPITLLAGPNIGRAFELSPMEMDYTLGSNQLSKTFYIENKNSTPVAAQIRVYRRTSDSQGDEVRSETKDFLVIPQQVLLGPHEKRAIRVTWRGAGDASEELAYRLIAEQLPLSTDPTLATDSKVSIKYLLKFVASIYVGPKNGSAKVNVESIAAPESAGGQMKFTIANSGTKHKTLKGARVIFKGAGSSAEVTSQTLAALDQTNLLPRSKATFQLPRPSAFPKGPLEGEVRFE